MCVCVCECIFLFKNIFPKAVILMSSLNSFAWSHRCRASSSCCHSSDKYPQSNYQSKFVNLLLYCCHLLMLLSLLLLLLWGALCGSYAVSIRAQHAVKIILNMHGAQIVRCFQGIR